jgi:hypothetical protein
VRSTLRQPAHPQQVSQVGGVTDIVLDPAVLKRLHPEWVRQVDVGAGRLQRIHRPVPAVGGLEHHLGILTGSRHHAVQPVHIIEDLRALQNLTRLGGPNHHTPAAVQVNTHELPPCVL